MLSIMTTGTYGSTATCRTASWSCSSCLSLRCYCSAMRGESYDHRKERDEHRHPIHFAQRQFAESCNHAQGKENPHSRGGGEGKSAGRSSGRNPPQGSAAQAQKPLEHKSGESDAAKFSHHLPQRLISGS